MALAQIAAHLSLFLDVNNLSSMHSHLCSSRALQLFIRTYPNILPRASLAVMGLPIVVLSPAPAAPMATANALNVRASANHVGHLQLEIEQPCWALLAPFLRIGGVDHDLAAQTVYPPGALGLVAEPDDNRLHLMSMLLDLLWYPIWMCSHFGCSLLSPLQNIDADICGVPPQGVDFGVIWNGARHMVHGK